MSAKDSGGKDNQSPISVGKALDTATKKVPALRYAYGVVGIAAAVVEIAGLYKSIQINSVQIIVATTALVIVGMVLVWLFARLTDEPNAHPDRAARPDPAARVVVWASVGLFVVVVGLMISMATIHEPTYLAQVLGFPDPPQPPELEQDRVVRSMLAMGLARGPVDPQIHENRRFALAFIDEHFSAWCARKQDPYCAGTSIAPTDTASLPTAPIVADKSPLPAGDPCALTALANAPVPKTIFGLDVSHHSGTVDWDGLKAKGYFFVAIKATQGVSLEDPKFVENWEAAGRAGFIRSAYHFITGDVSANEQASFFLNVLKKVSLGSCDLPPLLDFEGISTVPSAAPNQALEWLKIVSAAVGKRPLLYSGHYLKSVSIDPVSSGFAEYPLWLAQYGPSPVLPVMYSRYAFWNFTDGVIGIRPDAPEGHFDISQFNGGREELFSMTKK